MVGWYLLLRSYSYSPWTAHWTTSCDMFMLLYTRFLNWRSDQQTHYMSEQAALGLSWQHSDCVYQNYTLLDRYNVNTCLRATGNIKEGITDSEVNLFIYIKKLYDGKCPQLLTWIQFLIVCGLCNKKSLFVYYIFLWRSTGDGRRKRHGCAIKAYHCFT